MALANKNLLWDAMLRTFGNGLKGANVTNHLILALDRETLDFCKSEGLNGHRMNVEDLKVRGPAHRWAGGALDSCLQLLEPLPLRRPNSL